MLLYNKKARGVASRLGMPFGAGALLAAAFVGLLPEALESGSPQTIGLYAMGGFLVFFALERLLGWFHHHEEHHHSAVHGQRDATHQWLVIIGDTVHNAIDGVALGAAFLVSPEVGIATAVAIAAHEVPQEIGDFSILLSKGMKPSRVIIVNLLSALATVVAALAVFVYGSEAGINLSAVLSVTAGFFIYIAASDIVPDIHEKPRREGNIQAVMLAVGAVTVSLILLNMHHS